MGIGSLILIFGIMYMVYVGWIIPNEWYAKDYPIRGCDVSSYQGRIDWETLQEQDIQFVFIKATEGSSYIDEYFYTNWEMASRTDLMISAYHFFSFDSKGKTQAEHFIRTVSQKENMLPPVVDVEFYADKKENKPNPEDIRAELNDYLAAVEHEYQRKPIIYTTKEMYSFCLEGYYNDYPLWIRSILTTPNIDKEWTFWQYTNREKLNGYIGKETYIDMNFFYGSEEEWKKFVLGEEESSR